MGIADFAKLIEQLNPLAAPFQGRVGVGLSGGGDSLALLLLLQMAGWRKQDLLALHIDHAKRSESVADAAFVADFARRHGVMLQQARLDTAQTASAAASKLRDLRYQELWRLAKAHDCQALAMAHSAEDQRETRLLAMLRGAGLRGLAGMRSWQGGIWRPLLNTSRVQLREFLRARGEVWLEDRSNLDFTSARARLRHVLLPSLGRPLSHSEIKRVQMLQDEDDFLEQQTQAAAQSCLNNDCLILQNFAQLAVPLQRRLLRQWLNQPALQLERIEALRLALLVPPPSRIRTIQVGQKLSVQIGAKLATKK